ncbi:MAG: BrnA antitoxin family protein [Xanthomonadales bacterium]|nr:BrnA antitoxin family protein [Xanthomonadales bacterium]
MVTNVKRTATSSRIDPTKRAAALAAAAKTPVRDIDNPRTEVSEWDDAILSRSVPELRAKLAQRRTRGPGKQAARTPLTLRIPPDVLARWRATGPGWQTRMVERLSKL